jgi:outer membrane receptor for ferrienterochelin and colicin
MKKIFTLSLLFFAIGIPQLIFAQKGNSKITGVVMDSVTRKPVEFANVALLKADSNTPIDGAVCNEKGEFSINKVGAGSYNVSITFIGFQTRTININIEDKNDDVNLGSIIISPTQQVLKEVTVEGQKAIIEERVDRTIYNAENDATAKGGDATDVLKRVPMLSVDLDGNVSLRGNQNIMVLINNKPSTIVASNVADALKQIPADQIKSVEVITSPSAKYDAEGSAGIINIITKKNNLEGVTLNVDAGVGLRGSNLGLNGNFRKGKMGFSLGGFGRANYNVSGNFENEQRSRRDEGEILSIQSADTRNSGLFGNYNLGWDYDIDKKNALAASVRFGVRNQNSYQDDLTTEQFINDLLQNNSLGEAVSKDQSNNVDANFTYTHYYDKPQRELSFQGLFSRNNRENDFENIYRFQTNENSPDRFKNLNDSYNQEITIQADYQTPIGSNQMLEFGGKDIMRKVFSDYESFAANAEEPYTSNTDGRSTNNLNYDQNVLAGYLSYTLTTKAGYSFKAGSRYEYTTISAYTETEDDIVIPSYGVIVPSLNVSKKLKNGNTLKASYNRRIQRPSIRFLNPNIQYQNDLNVTEGNPELDPEYTNNYEIGYTTLIKGAMLNMTAFARNTNDAIQSVRAPAEINGQIVNRTTYENIGVENAYGTSIFANINIGKLSLNGGTDIYYATLDNNSNDENLKASNEGWVASGRMFGSYNLTKGWGFQFFGFYRGRQVQLQGTQGGFYTYSLALRKEFNEKRGSIGIGAENFLQSAMKIKTELNSPLLQQASINTMNNVSFKLTFSYRIGKMSMDNAPRRRKSINNDDLKDGGGDNMQMGGDGQQQRGQMPAGGGQRNQGQRPQPSGNNQTPSATTAQDTVVHEAAGTWNFNIDSPQGGNGVIVIKNDGGKYSGTIKTNRMQQETILSNVDVQRNNVSFSYPVNFGGNTGTVDVKYAISKDDIQGTMNIGQFGSFNLTGKKAN